MAKQKIKILWIDDDIFRYFLRPYIDEFNDNGMEIIPVSNPDEIDNAIISNSDIKCVIIDVSMPTGESISFIEAKGGMRTGLMILQKMNNDPTFCNVPKVIFTIADDPEIKTYCNANQIPYLYKREYLADSFVIKIKNVIKKQQQKKQKR